MKTEVRKHIRVYTMSKKINAWRSISGFKQDIVKSDVIILRDFVKRERPSVYVLPKNDLLK